MKKLIAAMTVAGAMTAGAAQAGEGNSALLMSDADMDQVVGGVVIATTLRTGAIIGETPSGDPIHKSIDMTGKGPEKMLTGQGPDNNGTTVFQDFELETDPPLPPGFSVTVDGILVGAPSNGRGRFPRP